MCIINKIFDLSENMTGIIEFLISNHPAVVRLRKNVVFQLIPMMNPDGVTLGNSR